MLISYSVSHAPTQAELTAVDQQLGQFDSDHGAMNDVQSLGVFAEVAAGQVVGGAVGRTWGQCCELQQLAVAPEHRRQGVGERLLQHFEKAAATRGCTLVYLDTFSFQAPDFYRRCGYHVAFETRGFAQDIVKYTLHKLLPASRT